MAFGDCRALVMVSAGAKDTSNLNRDLGVASLWGRVYNHYSVNWRGKEIIRDFKSRSMG